MIETPEVVIESVWTATGDGTQSLRALVSAVLAKIDADSRATLTGVVAATFSNPERFPALAVRVAAELGLPPSVPAFDLQLACSAYPYALYLAGRIAADTGGKVLVVDGDVQTRLTERTDHATGSIFSDAATASIVGCGKGVSRWAFLSRADEALACGEVGPIRMDGMRVFSFVATDVRQMLDDFVRACGPSGFDRFVPHQANPYMVRQLAGALDLEDRLVVLPEGLKNPGSCSIPLTLERSGVRGRTLIAGFGAGYSAAAGVVRVA